ncbi:gamma-glutamylcyclotransferase [Drosophila tropicalis]|uniref:gamma-glutamylcyclotransferase n=1 Tax=Drosophila tropicalis TaxID=46794 RepID=UPI0035ABE338
MELSKIIIICLCLMAAASTSAHNSQKQKSSNNSQELPEIHGNKFYYFGFGSNMLKQRIHIQNPTAVRIGAALLKDYRLDFAGPQNIRWHGAIATIVPTPKDSLWGTLWDIDLSNLADIDNQEGVHLGLYVPVTVQVQLIGQEGKTNLTAARAYMLTNQPETNLYELPADRVPESRQPSETYLKCLVKGAIESSIPQSYIQRLRSIKHNGQVDSDLQELLQLRDVEL